MGDRDMSRQLTSGVLGRKKTKFPVIDGQILNLSDVENTFIDGTWFGQSGGINAVPILGLDPPEKTENALQFGDDKGLVMYNDIQCTTLIIMFEIISLDARRNIISERFNSSTNTLMLREESEGSTSDFRALQVNGSDLNYDNLGATITYRPDVSLSLGNQYFIFDIDYVREPLIQYFNEQDLPTITTTSATQTLGSSDYIQIGGRFFSTFRNFFTGKIYEIRGFNRELSLSEKISIDYYYKKKYNL